MTPRRRPALIRAPSSHCRGDTAVRVACCSEGAVNVTFFFFQQIQESQDEKMSSFVTLDLSGSLYDALKRGDGSTARVLYDQGGRLQNALNGDELSEIGSNIFRESASDVSSLLTDVTGGDSAAVSSVLRTSLRRSIASLENNRVKDFLDQLPQSYTGVDDDLVYALRTYRDAKFPNTTNLSIVTDIIARGALVGVNDGEDFVLASETKDQQALDILIAELGATPNYVSGFQTALENAAKKGWDSSIVAMLGKSYRERQNQL